MSILSVCREIAKRVGHIYGKGKKDGEKAERRRFWQKFFASQQELKSIGSFSGAGWNEQTFTPDRTICAESLGTGNANTLFSRSAFSAFPAFLEDGVTPALDSKKFSTMGSIFSNCTKLVQIHAPLDLSMSTNMTTAFSGDTLLSSMHLSHVEKVSLWTSAFKDCTSLYDIGQEEDEFGYFSASVDLSQTAINFGTPKMSLCNLSRDWRQENSYLKFDYDGEMPTLKISRQQYDAAQAYLDLDYSSEEGGPYFELNLVGGCGWMLAVD